MSFAWGFFYWKGEVLKKTVTLKEMGTHLLESILQTRCMVLVFIVLQMDIDTRVLGMKEEDKVLVCILLEMEMLNRVIGITGFSVFQNLDLIYILSGIIYLSFEKY